MGVGYQSKRNQWPKCWRRLEGWGLEKMIKAASLSGALVASRLECSTAMPTRAELETMLETGDVL